MGAQKVFFYNYFFAIMYIFTLLNFISVLPQIPTRNIWQHGLDSQTIGIDIECF
jgi:hypothetical protein